MWRPERQQMDRSATHEFPLLAQRVSSAREFVRDTLCSWEIDCPEAIAVVGELASNAVRHGKGPFEVHLVAGVDKLRLEVHDRSPSVPAMRSFSTDSLGGRGLHIVEAYSASWGVEPVAGNGKCVWAEVCLAAHPKW